MATYLKVHEVRTDGEVCLALEGDLDMYTQPTLRNHFQELLKASESVIRLDLAQVGYLDSEGVATLLWALAQQRQRKAKLWLGPLSPRVAKLLNILGLGRLLEDCMWESPEQRPLAL